MQANSPNPIRPKTRDAILHAAFLTLSDQPGASLGDVAARAGVSRATLYRYFVTRHDLMLALAQIAQDELELAVANATRDAESYSVALRQSLFAIVPLADRQWFLASDPVARDPDITMQYQNGMQELCDTIDAARYEGTFAPDVPTRWIARAFDNLVYVAWTAVRNEESTPAQAADLAWRTLINGVGKDGTDHQHD